MRQNRFITVLLIACACAVWVYTISLVADIASLWEKRGPQTVSDAEATGSSALVDKALGLRPAAAAARYRDGIESPFKMVSEAHRSTVSAPRRSLSAPSRPRLVLKGVLFKSNPLAILEDARGATSILGIGDTLFGQKVAGITKTSVTLRDSHGTYELSVKE